MAETYSKTNPHHGFRRAWAALRFDEHQGVNKKKVHRLWKEDGLQRRVHSSRQQAGISSCPTVDADAPKGLWASDFQFDSTVDCSGEDHVDDRRAAGARSLDWRSEILDYWTAVPLHPHAFQTPGLSVDGRPSLGRAPGDPRRAGPAFLRCV